MMFLGCITLTLQSTCREQSTDADGHGTSSPISSFRSEDWNKRQPPSPGHYKHMHPDQIHAVPATAATDGLGMSRPRRVRTRDMTSANG